MAKLTRKSYKRKKIAFAAVILGGVALVSSGFAAWVLSNNAKDNANGSVHVGEVKDASLEMNITLLTKRYTQDTEDWKAQTDRNSGKFNFNPAYNDVEGTGGRVYNDQTSNDSFDCENLVLRYKIVITSSSKSAFKELKVLMAEKDNGTKIQTATSSDKNWVVAPACFNKEEIISATSTSESSDKKFDFAENKDGEQKVTGYSWTLNYDLAFNWGTAFGGKNPGEYFDTGAGKDVPLKRDTNTSEETKTVQEILEEMHTTLDGASFELTFTAVAQ